MKKSIPRSQVVRIIDGDGELKHIAGQAPDLERTMSELGKPILKKHQMKNKEKQKINDRKPLARK